MRFSQRTALAVLLVATGPCAATIQAEQPPMVCRQVLTLDVRPAHKGDTLLISLCAPLQWWLTRTAEPVRADTGTFPRVQP
jgi:hypothetical protein